MAVTIPTLPPETQDVRPKPLLLREDGTAHRFRPRAADPERSDDPALCRDPGVHLAPARRADGAELAGRNRLWPRRAHRPARRLPGPALARRVAVRQGRRSTRRPVDDRHGGRAARRARPIAVGRARSSCSATSSSSADTSSSSRRTTSSRSPDSGRSRRGGCTRRSASSSSRAREPRGRSSASGSTSRSRSSRPASTSARRGRRSR